ncbi:hypothetical protein ON010_g15108 [Phytophthora cinnamomi]|nr:hypothetical protein ON010_g15108 [Phytophthora cinnamomi]
MVERDKKQRGAPTIIEWPTATKVHSSKRRPEKKKKMVAPTPKTPRYELTEQERRLCREALLSERHGRRIWRAEQKEGNEGTNKKKKESRKKPSKHTTPAMEIAESKQRPAPVLDARRASPAESNAAADDDASGAKETADDEVAASFNRSTSGGLGRGTSFG